METQESTTVLHEKPLYKTHIPVGEVGYTQKQGYQYLKKILITLAPWFLNVVFEKEY